MARKSPATPAIVHVEFSTLQAQTEWIDEKRPDRNMKLVREFF